RMTGALDDAEASCERALAGNPRDCQAHYLRSDLRRQTPASNHIAEMETLLATNTLAWRAEVLLRFALAKEQEDIGAYPQSFAHLKAGADLHRRHIRYDVRDDIAVIDEIIRTHSAQAVQAAAPGHRGAAPVFIVGLPRTGTTLVERIVASHSAALSLGELTEFGFLLTRAAGDAAGRQDLVRKSLTLDMAMLGRAYVERTQPIEAGQAARFIDKMPQNYLYCGLIHAALPEAKIILLHRRPLDACYAVYKAHFSGAYPFSFDLGDLGEYYLAYRRLVAHWKSVLPPACLFEIAYEDIVADLAGAARRILDFLDLPWEEGVSRFHESTAPSTTASAVQVRRPVYATSIGKWKAYARELAPLRARLAQGLEAEELE
ncbi:MAG TPA: sulfotransferase, partial [Rhizomicrobium sp.]